MCVCVRESERETKRQREEDEEKQSKQVERDRKETHHYTILKNVLTLLRKGSLSNASGAG